MSSVTSSFHVGKMLDQTFGFRNHFLRALVVMWFTSYLGLTILNLLGVLSKSYRTIALSAALTLMIVLLSSFSANCFVQGGCINAAYIIASVAILVVNLGTIVMSK